MTRAQTIAAAEAYFDSGQMKRDLAHLVSIRTESPNPDRAGVLLDYLTGEMQPLLERMGFSCRILTHQKARGPFLFAERIEDPALPTILGYGHGDVILGLEGQWKEGLDPWILTERDGLWFGRGTADNKGQHLVNLKALETVLNQRGRLGFNAKYLIEMGEETGSAGLRELCSDHAELFAADVLIASDGPRLATERPTVFLGARGFLCFDLRIISRDAPHHNGNWGGLLSDPAIQLAHAIASITTATGKILIPEWLPNEVPASVRRALADCQVDGGPKAPRIDPDWGEPGLTRAEQVYGWCSFDVLAMEAGQPRNPIFAIPPSAWARCGLRFVVGIDPLDILPALRRHLDHNGFSMVEIVDRPVEISAATRLDPDDPWVGYALDSIRESTGKQPALLPNMGGSLPNDIFADVLKLRTIWVPHSYPGCQQHSPDEHLPASIAREGVVAMAGLYWDIGSGNAPAL